ncbi:MAG: AtpZ/AtpI family protein [Patescibacteria group bacterium]|nr:AtpZ/AtpI family protein [Patescibacteria group bacterium]
MDEPGKNDKLRQLQAIGMVWNVIVSIALPTTLMALGGRWLDRRLGSSPWMTIVGLLVALGISYLLVMRQAKKIAEMLKTPKS